ncbi:type III pantothenate kinase [Cyanobium sp. Morenito 9A2]|uniref:type III pantothenate kinase n=1 Tax=Cyanobium sp. Morenito 9A2 TaxID=2823718 RepID=UPI0020CEFB9E|nr:type III pantothenate kinase [Cyanobium sp. Morenito 9A2]MCP9849858.1 type III pantothenate kinase [Cyanobium sp. Morenito 9A2]
MAGSRRWLLIGNSRWHWVESGAGGPLRYWHHMPPQGGLDGCGLEAWAAVGPVEPGWNLPERLRFDVGRVPLEGLPPWLGIDRALAGWGAWRREQLLQPGAAVLVADAGTALSLTRVDGGGHFRGGRLMAGFGLQLRALAAGTAALPAVPPAALAQGLWAPGSEPWPEATAAAMATGVAQGLAAAVRAAAQELAGSGEPTALWLTGGDGPVLRPLLDPPPLPLRHNPDLVLAALVALSSDPDP